MSKSAKTNLEYPSGWVHPEGPVPSRIALIGEAPGNDEQNKGRPFVGVSGQELDRMLNQVGILRSEVFLTNVLGIKPPSNDIETYFKPKPVSNPNEYTPTEVGQHGLDLLWQELEVVQPSVIVTCGNVPLWAITGNTGITRWRGSSLIIDAPWGPCVVVPVYHPAAILRQWPWRAPTIRDLQRVASYIRSDDPVSAATPPESQFIVRPTFEQAMDTLRTLTHSGPDAISCDIETRLRHIACTGFGWSDTEAICIPSLQYSPDSPSNLTSYWTESEEKEIVLAIQDLFKTYRDFVFQNGSYDLQYFARYWGFLPHRVQDTMIGHHTNWCNLPKALHFIASLYCQYYTYWKDDGKEWNPKLHDDERLWWYNCDDCVKTLESWWHIESDIDRLSLREQYEFQMRRFWNTFRTMLRGTSINREKKAELSIELLDYSQQLQDAVNQLAGRPLNPRSPKQMKEFFYEELKLPKQHTFAKGQKRETLNEQALETLAVKEPLAKPLIRYIQDLRSAGVFRSTYLEMPIDHDGRVRCSYNVAGTNTFRLSSSADAFGFGTNLQTLSSGGDEDDWEPTHPDAIPMPNVKKLFKPDPGYTICDIDLDRADLQVVVYEAGDDDLKARLHEGLDVHLANARDLFSLPFDVDDLRDPELYARIKKRYGRERQFAKAFCHGSNYAGSARTMAIHCKCTVAESEAAQKRWFTAHPGIKEWHRRVEHDLQTTRTIYNKFGYRCYFFDRIENILPDALAWIPQSTVGLVIDKFWDNVENTLPEVEVLLQVHDSLVIQYPTRRERELLPQIKEAGQITVPYDDPLIIPIGAKTATTNLGECKEIVW